MQIVVQGKWLIGQIIVDFGVAANFAKEEGRGEDGHNREGNHGLAYFKGDLVFEIFKVDKGVVVEDEDIG